MGVLNPVNGALEAMSAQLNDSPRFVASKNT